MPDSDIKKSDARGGIASWIRLLALTFVIAGVEVAIHILIGSNTSVGQWLLPMYSNRHPHSGRNNGYAYLVDLMIPAIVLGLAVSKWGQHWSIRQKLFVCFMLVGGLVGLQWLDYHFLPLAAVWWVPKEPLEALWDYVVWNFLPAMLLTVLCSLSGWDTQKNGS